MINNVRLRPGMNVTALYDADQAVPLIYPPQYRAVLIGRRNPSENVYAGYFDENLMSADASLQLNIDNSTSVVTANGQTFQCSPGGHTLGRILQQFYPEYPGHRPRRGK